MPLPPSLILRAQRYRRFDADPLIRARTDFFAAAVLVTQAILRAPSIFLMTLSEELEDENARRADAIRAGYIYRYSDVQSNTRDFIHFEQTLVEHSFQQLAIRNRRRYRREVHSINHALALASSARLPFVIEPRFSEGVARTIKQLGRSVDIRSQAARELLGLNLARASRQNAAGTMTALK